jgi:pimeloyl-ACP methyl ester carboxylesterase
MTLLHIETPVRGRVLLEDRGKSRLLAGFHGYAETAEIHMAELAKIPGIREWSVAAIQALHPFYSKGGTVIGANWMTSQDRELAIADNINYVRRALAALPQASTTVFLGFSQGAAMAARAAAAIPCDGLILLGGDIPPDVRETKLPPLLLARGTRDDWYTEEKFRNDLSFVTPARTLIFEGGHEFSDEFREAAAEFLRTLNADRRAQDARG